MRYILKKIKYLSYIVLLIIGFNSFIFAQGGIVKPMSPARLVNDFAQIIPPSAENHIEEKLVAYDDSTSTQITVVTINSLQGYDIAEYAFELGDQWGVGREGRDNGVILLVASQDRKTFIATGRGSEGAVPDVIAKRIVDRVLIPNFRNGDYAAGIDEATDILMKLLSGEFTNDLDDDIGDGIPLSVILVIILIIIVIIYINRNNDSGGQVHRRGWGGPIIINSGGWPRGGGGWSGGGGFGGSSGGFGGFGGGSFGGGGAGGSW